MTRNPVPVIRIDGVSIVEPLTSPECDLRSILEDVLHFGERFLHADVEILGLGVKSGVEQFFGYAVGEDWSSPERNIRYIRATSVRGGGNALSRSNFQFF